MLFRDALEWQVFTTMSRPKSPCMSIIGRKDNKKESWRPLIEQNPMLGIETKRRDEIFFLILHKKRDAPYRASRFCKK